MDSNTRSSVSLTVHKTLTMQLVKVEPKTAPRIECRLHKINERPAYYHPVQIFIDAVDTGVLKTQDEPRS